MPELPPVTDAEVIALLEHGFRNIELPPLNSDDIADIRGGLERFARTRSSPPIPSDSVERDDG